MSFAEIWERNKTTEKRKSLKEIAEWMYNEYYRFLPSNVHTSNKYQRYYDVYDHDKLCEIINNFDELQKEQPEIYKNGIFNDCVKLLYASSSEGVAPIYYKQNTRVGDDPYGRLYAYRGVGLQTLKREIRNQITKDYFADIDINNAHPSILLMICDRLGYEVPYLRQYVEHREEFLKKIYTHRNTSRDDAKHLMLCIMYRSNFSKKGVPNEVIKFDEEIRGVTEKLLETNDEFKRIAKNRYYVKHQLQGKPLKKLNLMGSTLSMFLQQYENNILARIKELFEKLHIIKNDMTTLMFDGLYVPLNKTLLNENLYTKVNKILEIEYCKYIKILCKTKLDGINDWNETKKTVESKLKFISSKTHKTKELNRFKQIKSKNFFVKPTETNANDIIIPDKIYKGNRLPDTIIDDITTNDSTYLVARMGSGKTYQLHRYIKENTDKRILIVTFRRSLGMKYKEDFDNFHYYEDNKEDNRIFTPENHPKLIIQLDSFGKVRGEYDVLVLDEASYTLDRLYTTVNSQIKSLINYITNINKLIVMDAYLCNQHVKWFNSLRPHKVNNCITLDTSQTENIGHIKFIADEHDFIKKVNNLVKNDKRLVIASNSKSFLDTKICALFDAATIYKSKGDGEYTQYHRGKDDDELEIDEESKTIKNKKVLLITSDAKLHTLSVDTWVQFDVVMYSPTIIAGVSFDIPDHFDVRMGYFTDRSSEATLCVQQLFRVRNPKDPNIYLHVNSTCSSIYYDFIEAFEEGLDGYMDRYANLDKDISRKDPILSSLCRKTTLLNYDTFRRQYIKDTEYYMVRNRLRRYFDSKKDLAGEILRLMKIQGYEFVMDRVIVDDEWKKMFLPVDKVDKDLIELIDINRKENKKRLVTSIRKLGPVSEDEFNCIKNKIHKMEISREDTLRYRSYLACELMGVQDINDVDDNDLYKALQARKSHEFDYLVKEVPSHLILSAITKKIETYNQLIIDGTDSIDSKSDGEDYKEKNNIHKYNQYYKIKWIKRLIANKIVTLFGFNNFRDLETKVDILNEDKLNEFKEYIKDNKMEIKVSFPESKIANFDKYKRNSDKIRCFNGLLQCIGRKLKPVKENISGKKEITGYKLHYVFDKFNNPRVVDGTSHQVNNISYIQ